MNCIFLYNPKSGKGKINNKIDYIISKLKTKFDKVEVKPTTKAGDMRFFAKSACNIFDYIVFAGGDGTVNEVIDGISGESVRPILAYIPTGTVNDVSRNLKISRNINRAVKNILEGEPVAIDCLKINDRYAQYVVTAGTMTSATYETSQKYKKLMGAIAYYVEGIKNHLNYDTFPIKIKINGEEIETDVMIVMILNSVSVGGYKINKKAKFDDSKFEGLIIKSPRKVNWFFRIIGLAKLAKVFLFGFRQLKFEKDIAVFNGDTMEIETGEDIVWNFDGEKGISGNIKIQVMPKHIQYIAPQKLIKGKKLID